MMVPYTRMHIGSGEGMLFLSTCGIIGKHTCQCLSLPATFWASWLLAFTTAASPLMVRARCNAVSLGCLIESNMMMLQDEYHQVMAVTLQKIKSQGFAKLTVIDAGLPYQEVIAWRETIFQPSTGRTTCCLNMPACAMESTTYVSDLRSLIWSEGTRNSIHLACSVLHELAR